MARGDVVSDIQSITTNNNLDFQPAVGVEVMITHIGSDKVLDSTPDEHPHVQVKLYDGTNESIILSDSSARRWAFPLKLFITNSIRLRILNRNAATALISYTGIQTK